MSGAENTEVGSESTIEKSGSSSDFTTFDDMENIGNENPEAKPKSKVDKEMNVDDKKDDKKVDKKPAPDKKEQDKSTDDATSKKTGQSADDKKAADAAAASKILKFKNGDADLDVPASAKVTVKIDGKDEVVDVQTLVNEYSGKTNFGRKAQELDTEKKTFYAERQELNDGIDTLYDLAITKKDPMSAVAYLSDMLGGDGVKTVQEIQTQMFKDFEELMKLTPEQRAAKQEKDRADLLQKKLDQGKSLEAKKGEQAKVAKRVDEIKTKYSMNDDQFKETHEALKKLVEAKDLTPELVGEVYQRWQHQDQIDELVLELDIKDEKAKGALLGEWYKDPSLTKAQIKAIAVQVYNIKSPKSALEKKIERNGGQQQQPPAPKKENGSDAITFDDL